MEYLAVEKSRLAAPVLMLDEFYEDHWTFDRFQKVARRRGRRISRAPLSQQQQLSEWDEFFVKVAREVEAVMKREMFTPPGGATYLPGEYIIYLSKEDDALWQGRKARRA